ncbi:MAG: hypothetical protein M1812_007605 [Candelaria pacifica]|nr:MAG: hypothetical protein M1812_007605 [Candelaria pacifica]
MSSQRLEVARANISHRFEKLKTIDSGVWESGQDDGPGKGALNAGVYLVRRKKDGKVCVEKRIPPRKELIREIHYLRRLHHPNICEYVDAFISKQPPTASLYMEYCDLGTMDGVIDQYRKHAREQRKRIPEAFIWKTFFQIADALQYIHQGIDSTTDPSTPIKDWIPILHHDIKPSNIFIKSTPNPPPSTYPRLVLGDFGIAVSRRPQDMRDWENKEGHMIGTLSFMPPQAPENDLRSDVWSLGASIQCMCRLEQHMQHRNPHGVPEDVWMTNPRSRLPKEIPIRYSTVLVEVLGRALSIRKGDRPFASGVVELVKKGYRKAGAEFEKLPEWVFGGKGVG